MKTALRCTFLFLLFFGAAQVSADDSSLLREMQDRKDIEHLMWRYVRALDTLDADAYAGVFTEDGRFSSGSNVTQGRENLRRMVSELRQGRERREAEGAEPSPPMHHVIANSWIEFLGDDRARMHSYWMTVFGSGPSAGAPNVAAVGRGVDELVRIEGEWLIRSRNVAPEENPQ